VEIELVEHESIGGVDAAQWDALAAGLPMLKHSYLRAMERVSMADIRRRYLLWQSSDGELLAHGWCFSMTSSPERMLPQDHWASRFSRRMPRWIREHVGLKVVVCGSATTVGHTLCFRADLSDSQRDRCLQQLTTALHAFAVEQRARIIILRDFHLQDAELTASLPTLRFIHVPNLDDTVIPIRWRSFDDYLSALKSHYRKQIMRQEAALTRAGVSRQRTSQWAEHAQCMAKLFANVARRYPGGSLIGADYFAATSGCLGHELETTLFFQEGELVAFIMYYVGEESLFASYLGVDETMNREAALTFNAYNEVVKVAIERGVDHLWFGRTAYNAKLRMGAERRALSIYLQTRPGFIGRRIGQWVQGRPSSEGPDRWNVFRRVASADQSGA
jgi:predicted N-acyltransferase